MIAPHFCRDGFPLMLVPATKPLFSFFTSPRVLFVAFKAFFSASSVKPKSFKSSRAISWWSIRHVKYSWENCRHLEWLLPFSRKHVWNATICGLHAPPWSSGKDPFSGGFGAGARLFGGMFSIAGNVLTTSAGSPVRTILPPKHATIIRRLGMTPLPLRNPPIEI